MIRTIYEYTINNTLSFVDCFQFLNSSSVNLIKNLNKDDFEYLCQEFDNSVLYLVKLKGFYPYEYMSDFEIIHNKCQAKKIFYSPLAERKTTDKKYKHVLNVWKKKRNENNERLS